MKIYKEVLIENVEQAKDLPVGAVAVLEVDVAVKTGNNEWEAAGSSDAWSNRLVIGWTTLEAVDAEVEERVVHSGARDPFPEIYYSTGDDKVRDLAGNDITERYTQWMKSLPYEKRIVTEWS